MIRVGIVGLGKMGISHLAMINAHPQVSVVGVCDTSGYMLSILAKYSGLRTFTDMDQMLAEAELDAVIISTPSALHAPMVRKALDRGLHVFCEKPFCLDPADSAELTAAADLQGLVTQVGYHNRFVGAFQEVKRLLDAGAIGTVTHVLAEAYGPVVLKPQGGTWRSRRSEGGGCLYDYAAHPIDLLTWYLGEPTAVGGTILNKVFSRETDDEVISTLFYGADLNAQLSVNWCDESQRKMTTKITLWGTEGRIFADRQECQVFLRGSAPVPPGYTTGWNVRYTTDLTAPVWFYVRGEEYSAQLDAFVHRIESGATTGENSFASAARTDRIMSSMIADAAAGPSTPTGATTLVASRPPVPARRSLRRLLGAR